MTIYQGLLFAHVVAALVWVGGGTMLHVVAFRARTRGPEGLLTFSDDMEWIGKNVLTPAALLVLACGLGMVIDAWSFGEDWVIAALTIVFDMFFKPSFSDFGVAGLGHRRFRRVDGVLRRARSSAAPSGAWRVDRRLALAPWSASSLRCTCWRQPCGSAARRL